MEEIRLQKYLANCGVASRRKCEEYILQGKVKVNGKQILKLGTKVIPEKDEIEYNGNKIINQKKEYTYILLNKPIDYVTTVKDQFNRKTVLDLVKIKNKRLVPVGRLDMYTSGAIILTDDGDFVYKVTHPKHEINKTYNVTLVGNITKEEIEKLENGIDIGGVTTNKANVKILKIDEDKNISRLQITIHEGKNRQIRKMCEAINKKVLSLHRSKIGDITVKDLELGNWRYLKKNEIEKLLKEV
ncbi:MAG: pseudouridine synthase [Clostridia bacterium]|nr:pseudouridine synthase [Clostridia bacterium]